jgi:hypothetical protein
VSRKLGILAGGGVLPRLLVDMCREEGRAVFVLAFKGFTDTETLRDVEHDWVRLGEVGAALDALRKAGVEDLVLAGPVRRPSLAALRPDARALKFFARVGVFVSSVSTTFSPVLRLQRDSWENTNQTMPLTEILNAVPLSCMHWALPMSDRPLLCRTGWCWVWKR